MGDKEDIVQLEKSMIELSTAVGSMAGIIAELKTTVSAVADAVTVLSRSQVTIEHHTDKIDENSSDIKAIKKELVDLTNEIHGRCDITKDHIGTEDGKLYRRIEDTAKMLESNGWKRLFYVVSILTFLFGYLYLDIGRVDEDSNTKYEKIMTKLDEILVKVSDNTRNQAVNNERLRNIEGRTR